MPPLDEYKIVYKRIETLMEGFTARKEYMHWMGLYVLPNTFNGLYSVAIEDEKLAAYSLFMTNFRMRVSLTEFLGKGNRYIAS